MADKVVIGSEEWCAFPELNVPAIKARVDSGAKTSSMHAYDIQCFQRDGVDWVCFEVHPVQKNKKLTVQCEAKVVDRRAIKSSSGETESRYVISTPLTIFGETFDIEVTLTNRDSMGYRMLLGREAMSHRMLIDPAESFLLGDIAKQEVLDFYK